MASTWTAYGHRRGQPQAKRYRRELEDGPEAGIGEAVKQSLRALLRKSDIVSFKTASGQRNTSTTQPKPVSLVVPSEPLTRAVFDRRGDPGVIPMIPLGLHQAPCRRSHG